MKLRVILILVLTAVTVVVAVSLAFFQIIHSEPHAHERGLRRKVEPAEDSAPTTCDFVKPQDRAEHETFMVVGYQFPTQTNCTHHACQLNHNRAPVHLSTPNEEACKNVSHCVTLVIRTRHRLASVLRLVMSARSFYPALPVVIVDDIYSDKITPDQDFLVWLKQQSVEDTIYLQTRPGLSLGRNMGLALVRTRYFYLADDDFVFIADTDLEKMLLILEYTDLTAVGNHVDDYKYQGITRAVIVEDGRSPTIQFHTGVSFEKVPCFPTCYVVDNIKNSFMGRRTHVQDLGGWDVWRVFIEHEDFMMRSRLAGRKMAVCTDLRIDHQQAQDGLRKVRKLYITSYYQLLLEQFDVREIVFCDQGTINSTLDCGGPRSFYS